MTDNFISDLVYDGNIYTGVWNGEQNRNFFYHPETLDLFFDTDFSGELWKGYLANVDSYINRGQGICAPLSDPRYSKLALPSSEVRDGGARTTSNVPPSRTSLDLACVTSG
jgi:hypothetical protein